MLHIEKSRWKVINGDKKRMMTKIPSVTHPSIIDMIGEIDDNDSTVHINANGVNKKVDSYGVISDMMNGNAYFYVQFEE